MLKEQEIRWSTWRSMWRLWAMLGGGAWCASWVLLPYGGVASVKGLGTSLLLAPLFLVPLGVAMLFEESEGEVIRMPPWGLWAMVWQPVAALGGALSLAMGSSVWAVLLAGMWGIQTGLLALLGGWRLWTRRGGALEEIACDMGLLYLPVGGAWWVAYAMGWGLMGFPLLIVYLTAVHFHYAGFVVSLSTGLAGRWLRGKERMDGLRWLGYRLGGVVVILCPILVAVGFVFSSVLQVTMALTLAGGMLLMAGVVAFGAVEAIPRPWIAERWLAVWLLRIAASALVLTMALAVLYAVGEFQKTIWINIPQMAVWHGMTNVYGFSLCSLVAWALLVGLFGSSPVGSPPQSDETAGLLKVDVEFAKTREPLG